MPPGSLIEDILSNLMNRLHLETIHSRWFSGERNRHCWIQCIVMWITCKKFVESFLLKIILLRQFQIDQTKAETPIRILAFVFMSIPFNQFSNILVILVGGEISKVAWTTHQTNLAKVQKIKKMIHCLLWVTKTTFLYSRSNFF
jgi:hypothetical protein